VTETPSALALLSLTGIGKTYAVPVLQNIDLQFYSGEVLALAGENGAGKSTLSHIISGLLPPSSGSMKFLNQDFMPANRREAEALGIRVVMQELSLISTLSIAENLFLDSLPGRFGILNRRTLHEKALPLMKRVGLSGYDPDMPVGQLGVGQQQMVEIARGLAGECRLLILDEPTAMLSSHETELLFEQINQLRAQGVCLVYISHRLEEIKKIADRIAILRDGHLVNVQPVSQMSIDDIVHSMVGRNVSDTLDLGEREIGDTVLEARDLCQGSLVRNVNFALRQSEILGFAGLVGSGRTELMRLLFGADRPTAGEIILNGQSFHPHSPREAVQSGVAMITEDRKELGLLLPMSISTNTTLANLESVSHAGWINSSKETSISEHFISELKVRCQGAFQAVEELSGGNQQKIVLARWLHRDCSILLLDEPTRGIDIGARYEIYALLGKLSQQGKSMIVISSDLRELMLICDRICVMSAGRLAATFERDNWDQNAILAAAFSGYLDNTNQECA